MEGDTVQGNVDDQPGVSGGFNPLALIDPTQSDMQLNQLAGTASTDDALAGADESLLSQLGIAPGQGFATTGVGSSLMSSFSSVPSYVWLAAGGILILAVMMRK